ncbi:hypothetical protein F511_33026 [Dorcoceras hygrometricum]|uniref:Uncharacterized protein n=1 Tax=Dorcoceras hygrometricum TaxID=472368 RepID=A0A2Z7CCH7_9LAMI|nr:hypothetical protein F511_33026 [Dorcoceras hygrometricum]
MTFRSREDVISTTTDLGLIHSTMVTLESPNEGSSIDHQVTIYLHAQNITMFPTNETWSLLNAIVNHYTHNESKERHDQTLTIGPKL